MPQHCSVPAPDGPAPKRSQVAQTVVSGLRFFFTSGSDDIAFYDGLMNAAGDEQLKRASRLAGDQSVHRVTALEFDDGRSIQRRDNLVGNQDGLHQIVDVEATCGSGEAWPAASLVTRLNRMAVGAAAAVEQLLALDGVAVGGFYRPVLPRELGGHFGPPRDALLQVLDGRRIGRGGRRHGAGTEAWDGPGHDEDRHVDGGSSYHQTDGEQGQAGQQGGIPQHDPRIRHNRHRTQRRKIVGADFHEDLCGSPN